MRKLANLKHKVPTNVEIRANYHDNLKAYKETLQQKRNDFQKSKNDKLEKASQSDYDLLWKILKNSSEF